MSRNPRARWPLAARGGLAALLVLLSLGIGPVRLPPWDVLRALGGYGAETDRIIVAQIRLPRALLSVVIGFMLGLGGAALQGLLRNPLAAPSLFGAPQAAAFGAVATLSLGIADALSYALPVAAILGAFLSVFLLVAVAGRNASLVLLILAGLAVSSLAGAATALAMNLAPNPFVVAGAALLFWQRGAFRALTIGEEAAGSLGVDVARLRLLVILGVAMGVGASVAVTGTIGFIGLVSPHLMRPVVGPDPARLLLPSGLAGACLLTAADIAVRLIPSTTDVKVGVLTALIGVPFFLYLIVRERRSLAGGAAS